MGLWVRGGAVVLGDAEALEFCFQAGAAAAMAAPGEPDGVDHAVEFLRDVKRPRLA